MVELFGFQFTFGTLMLLLGGICAGAVALSKRLPRNVVIATTIVYGVAGVIMAIIFRAFINYPANPNVMRLIEAAVTAFTATYLAGTQIKLIQLGLEIWIEGWKSSKDRPGY